MVGPTTNAPMLSCRTTAHGPTRTTGDVRYRAAVRGIADIKRALSCDLVLLVLAAHHDLERLVRQRSLQRLHLVPWRAHPNVALLIGRQDHRHRLRMDRLHHRICICREEAVDLMRPRDRLRLGAAITIERGPNA